MAKNESALKPQFAVNVAVDEEIKETVVTDEEKHLYNLSQQKGWRLLDEFMQQRMEILDATNAQAIEKGLAYEEIGRNAIVIAGVKDFIRSVRNKVNDSKDAVEREDGTIR